MGGWLLLLLMAAPDAGRESLAARLILLDAQAVLGQPVRVRLELTNVGSSPIGYQGEHLRSSHVLEVWGPDGKRAPHVHGSVQTGDSPQRLDPGRTVTLLDGFDVAQHYHLPHGGRWRVQFIGRALELATGVRPPTSNVLEIELRPGRRAPATEVVERLLPVLPRGWELARTVTPGQIEVVVTGLVHSKRDQARVTLVLAEAPPYPWLRRWGQTAWGTLWGSASDQARNAWPAHRQAVARALGLRP